MSLAPSRPFPVRSMLIGGVIGVAVLIGLRFVRGGKPTLTLPHDFARSAHALLVDIYRDVEGALEAPWELVKVEVVQREVGAQLAALPLEPDLAARLQSHLENPHTALGLLAFYEALSHQYDDEGRAGFAAHIRAQPALREVPGSEHGLFAWEEEEEGDAEAADGPSDSERLIVLALGCYDAIFVQEEFWTGDLLPARYTHLSSADQPLIDRTRPLVVELLREVAGRLEPGEVRSTVEELAENKERSEAVTISVIDFLRRFVLQNARAFALRLRRRADLRVWLEARLEEELKSAGDGPLLGYLRSAEEDRRYAVQVVVDGLQGELMRGLAVRDGAPGFLRDALDRSLAPATPVPDGARRLEGHGPVAFLSHLVQGGARPVDYLPTFRRICAEGAVVRHPVASTPTISVRNLPLCFTGASVGGPRGTGIPNFHFVDRPTDRAYYFYGNDAFLLDALTEERGLRTQFSRLRSFRTISYFSYYDWDAQVSYHPILNLIVGDFLRDFGERIVLADIERRARTEGELRSLRAELRGLLPEAKELGSLDLLGQHGVGRRIAQLLDDLAHREDEGLPDFALLYNPWPDHFAHLYGPFSDEIVGPTGELARLDYWLARVEDAYRAAGVFDRTLFGMAGDHGLAPVHATVNPEDVVLAAIERERGAPIVVRKISSDEGEGPKLNHPLQPPSVHGVDVVVASTAGGNYMLDLFKDQGEGWAEQPLAEDLRAWTPISGGPPIDLLEELTTRLAGSLEYLAVRTAPCSPERASLLLLGTRDGALCSATIERRGTRIFVAGDAEALLGFAPAPFRPAPEDDRAELFARCFELARADDPSTWAEEADWRRLCAPTSRPDAVVQLARLYDLDRAGTINLFPLPGLGFNSTVPGRHAGESFDEKDAFLGFWGTPTRPAAVRPATIGSLAPTMYSWLTGQAVVPGEDGWGAPSLLDEVAR